MDQQSNQPPLTQEPIPEPPRSIDPVQQNEDAPKEVFTKWHRFLYGLGSSITWCIIAFVLAAIYLYITGLSGNTDDPGGLRYLLVIIPMVLISPLLIVGSVMILIGIPTYFAQYKPQGERRRKGIRYIIVSAIVVAYAILNIAGTVISILSSQQQYRDLEIQLQSQER